MLILRIDFKCPLCENDKDFYTMPMKKKVNNRGDFSRSLNEYEVMCKSCRKSYVLEFTIKNVQI